MKRVRLLLFGLAALLVLVAAAVAVAFTSGFQTWLVRRTLARKPELHLTVGRVSAGLKHVELRDVRTNQGGAILTLPTVSADLPLVAAGLGHQIAVTSLVATGWTLDLSHAAATPAPSAPPAGGSAAGAALTTGSEAPPANAAAQAFAGVFASLQWPVAVSVDGVRLEGEVILPPPGGRAKVTVTGGGLGSGREGKFAMTADAALNDPKVNSLRVRGDLAGAMDTPRTFSRLAAKFDAAASGAQFPNGVTLAAEVSAARSADGETYAASAVTQGRRLVAAEARLPKGGGRLTGTWRLDVADADLTPFLLGRPLPAFTATGNGDFDTDVTFAQAHASGRIEATADRLEVVRPALAPIGATRIGIDFDVAHDGSTLMVDRFNASFAGAHPVATIASLQRFQFNPKTRELTAADPARELVNIAMHQLPVAWVTALADAFGNGQQPASSRADETRVQLTGGDVRGEFVAAARSGGVVVRATKPLTVSALTATRGGRPLVQGVDIEVVGSGDYAPQGWQADIARLTAASGGATLLRLEGKAGQLAGAGAPLKATGRAELDLAALLLQPAAAQALVLARGAAAIDFVASLTPKATQLEAKLAITDLAAAGANPPKLPTLSGNLRADITDDGRIALHVPLVLEQEQRKSDLALNGTITTAKDGQVIDAVVTSTNLIVDDAKALAVLVPTKGAAPAASARPTPSPDTTPPWSGLRGTLGLQLKRVVYSDTFQVSDVTGKLVIDAGVLRLDHLRAGMGEGSASLSGTVAFEAQQEQPYALHADLAVQQFDPGPFLKALNPQQPPTVEGRFDVASKLAGRAGRLAELPAAAAGEFTVNSKGGIFRGVPVSVSNVTEKTGRIAELLASAGNAFGALTGRKEYADVANKSQAVAEVAKGLNQIPYDQLNVVVTRDEARNARLQEFTLISPEIRLSGSGQTVHQPGKPLLEDALTMDFKLRAQGHYADLLRYLGALEPQKDELGYAACTLPLKVTGTLGKPDTGELSTKIAQLAIEKSGVADKASELLNRLRGGK